jgi:hypothetical protein
MMYAVSGMGCYLYHQQLQCMGMLLFSAPDTCCCLPAAANCIACTFAAASNLVSAAASTLVSGRKLMSDWKY